MPIRLFRAPCDRCNRVRYLDQASGLCVAIARDEDGEPPLPCFSSTPLRRASSWTEQHAKAA